MYLTKEQAQKGKSANNGWNKKQINCLGEQWPLQGGWLRRIMSRDHSEETISKFISLRTPDKPTPEEKPPHQHWLPPEQVAAEKAMWDILTVQLGFREHSLNRTRAVERLMRHLSIQGHAPKKSDTMEWLAKWHAGYEPGAPAPVVEVVRVKKSRLTKEERRERRAIRRPKESFPVDVPWSNYTEYLKSDLWHAIRRVVLVESDHKCCACSKPATQVHHTAYNKMTMRGRDISKLVAICGECHHWIHFDGDEKLDLATANQRLEELKQHRTEFEEQGELDAEYAGMF